MTEEKFIKSAMRQFRLYKNLGDRTLERLSLEQLHYSPEAESNSITIIIQHMHGNMLSRWTDFLSSDGEKTWRKRDEEFEPHTLTKVELLEKWEEGWNLLFNTLSALSPADIMATILIRKEEMTAMEAIHRQIAHYAYHVGQIVYLGKQLVGSKWESLSMPKRNQTNK